MLTKAGGVWREWPTNWYFGECDLTANESKRITTWLQAHERVKPGRLFRRSVPPMKREKNPAVGAQQKDKE